MGKQKHANTLGVPVTVKVGMEDETQLRHTHLFAVKITPKGAIVRSVRRGDNRRKEISGKDYFEKNGMKIENYLLRCVSSSGSYASGVNLRDLEVKC